MFFRVPPACEGEGSHRRTPPPRPRRLRRGFALLACGICLGALVVSTVNNGPLATPLSRLDHSLRADGSATRSDSAPTEPKPADAPPKTPAGAPADAPADARAPELDGVQRLRRRFGKARKSGERLGGERKTGGGENETTCPDHATWDLLLDKAAPRIVYSVLTGQRHHRTRVPAVQQTWARHISERDALVFYSDRQVPQACNPM